MKKYFLLTSIMIIFTLINISTDLYAQPGRGGRGQGRGGEHSGFSGTCTQRGGDFIDENGDGVCDNFIDENGDGVCDSCATRGGRKHSRFNGTCTGEFSGTCTDRGWRHRQMIDNNDNGIPDCREDSLYVFHNYPNPFTTSSNIKFYIPAEGTVSIVITDINGNVITTLFEGSLTAGEHTYEFIPDGIDPGVYFYTITYNGFTKTRKMFYRG